MAELPFQIAPTFTSQRIPELKGPWGLPIFSSKRGEARAVNVRPPQLASVIFPLPAQASHLTGKILRPGCTGCGTRGKPVPLQAPQVCSLILGVIMSLPGRLSWAASFRADRRYLKETTPAKGDWLGRSFQSAGAARRKITTRSTSTRSNQRAFQEQEQQTFPDQRKAVAPIVPVARP